MLSITELYSLARRQESLDLFEHQFQAPRAKLRIQWVGPGAEFLLLKGPVDRQAFVHLLEALTPDGTVRLLSDALSPERVAGWRITVSAAKSVADLWKSAPPQYRKAIQESHLFATACVFQHLQERLGGKASSRAETNWLAGVRFDHFDHSKEAKGRLATDLVVLNLGLRVSGANREFSSGKILHSKSELKSIYQERLRSALESILGLEFEQGREMRIQGVPRETHFGSARRILSKEGETRLSIWERLCDAVQRNGSSWTRAEAKNLIEYGLWRKQVRSEISAAEKIEKRREQAGDQDRQEFAAGSVSNSKIQSQSKSSQSQSH